MLERCPTFHLRFHSSFGHPYDFLQSNKANNVKTSTEKITYNKWFNKNKTYCLTAFSCFFFFICCKVVLRSRLFATAFPFFDTIVFCAPVRACLRDVGFNGSDVLGCPPSETCSYGVYKVRTIFNTADTIKNFLLDQALLLLFQFCFHLFILIFAKLQSLGVSFKGQVNHAACHLHFGQVVPLINSFHKFIATPKSQVNMRIVIYTKCKHKK